MVNVRVSPSGPDLENSGGAPFDPGAGARLRLAEAVSTVGSTSNVITTVAQVIGVALSAAPTPEFGPMVTSLTLPSATKNYRAELSCDVMSDLTNADLKVTLGIQVSPDEVTWTDLVSNEHTLGFNAADTDGGGARSMKLVATLRPGTLFDVTNGDAKLAVRGTIKASAEGAQLAHATGSGDEAGVGSCHILLEEMF